MPNFHVKSVTLLSQFDQGDCMRRVVVVEKRLTGKLSLCIHGFMDP